MAGYTRQSAANIVPSANITAAPLNAEFNSLAGAFSGGTGHTHSGGVGDGPKLPLTSAITGLLPIANGGTNAADAPTARVNLGLAIGTNVQAYNATLNAISALAGTGFITHTGAGTVAERSFIAPTAGFTITDPMGISGNPTFTLTNDLNAIETLGSTGIAVRTATDTWAQRTVTGTSAEITVTNGDGVAGNPTISIPAAVTFSGKTITGGTYTSATLSNSTISGASTLSGTVTNSSTITGGTYTSPAISGATISGATVLSGTVTNTATVTGGTYTGMTDIAVADGGTGASTADAALTNLSAVGYTTQTLTLAQQGIARGNIGADNLTGTRNAIINGDFDLWRRGSLSSSANSIISDRWGNAISGTGNTVSRQAHTLGQTQVLGNPRYYYRNVVTSVAGANNYAILTQRIEGVKTFSGRTITITFYVKANFNGNIAIEFTQNFGTGGSPSADVNSIGSQQIPVNTTWTKQSRTVTIPSITGKALGTDNNDYLGLWIWMDAGSSYASRSASLPQQSGTFEFSHISVVDGDATGETDPFCARHIGLELALCHRYFQRVYTNVRGPASGAGQTFGCTVSHSGMRTAPAISRVGGGVFVNVSTDALTILSANESRYEITTAGAGDAAGIGILWNLEAEI